MTKSESTPELDSDRSPKRYKQGGSARQPTLEHFAIDALPMGTAMPEVTVMVRCPGFNSNFFD